MLTKGFEPVHTPCEEKVCVMDRNPWLAKIPKTEREHMFEQNICNLF